MSSLSSSSILVRIKILPHGEGLPVPACHSPEAAGADLMAAIDSKETVSLSPGNYQLLPAGFCMALPKGFEAQIRPRSGLAFRHGVTVLNSPGTIDSDYRGEVKVLLVNHGTQPFRISRGMRIAQMIIAPVMQAVFEPVDQLDASRRGAGGFGSTGS